MSRQQNFKAAKTVVSVQRILEWAFKTERVSLELPEHEEVLLGRGYGRGTWGGMAEQEQLGCRVDGGGKSDPHEDAEVVAAIVSNLTDQVGGKFMAVRVSELARAGATPDWMPGAEPRIVPKHVRFNGMSETEVCGHETLSFKKVDRKGRVRTRYRREEVRWCPVVESPSRYQIDRARGFYAEWWLALSEIRRCLIGSGQLRRHELSAAMPPSAPWERQVM